MTILIPPYRQSTINKYNACPKSALFAIQDTRRTPGPAASQGTMFHRWGHRVVRKMWANGEHSYPVELGMEELVDVLCQQDIPSDEVVPITMQQMKWLRVLVTKWCQNTRLDPRRVLATEERFFADLALPIGETVKITGQLDLLIVDPPKGLLIVDWKSGYRRPPTPRNQEKTESEGTGLTSLGWVQWLVYTYLLFEEFPHIDHVIFREVHVLWGEERQARMERWEMERLRDVLAAQVALLHQAVKEGPDSPRWVPSAGPHCSMCSNPRACPIIQDEQIDITTELGRRRVAQEWHVAGEVRTRRRNILDGLVETYGPIEIPHADGRRVVGWDVSPDGKRNFGMFEPRDVPESPYDLVLAKAAREVGVLAE